MTAIPLSPSTAFASSSYSATPFGYFDNDPIFKSDADSMVTYVRRKLGGATVTTEITEHDVWTCFEDATFEFQSYINMYQARDLMFDMIGTPSGSLDSDYIPKHSIRLLQHYAAPLHRDGSSRALYSASTTFASSQQHKDIHAELVAAGSIENDDIVYIKDVHYAANVQVYRLFNTTSALNYLNREFNFQSYIPEVMFYLLPIWEDTLRTQEFKMSDRLRRSNYSYKINKGILSIYPAPKLQKTIWYTYSVEPMGSGSIYSSDHYQNYLSSSGSVTGAGNAQLKMLPYGSLNYMSKQFIKRICMAMCKELLGQVRSKFASIPIPDASVDLNGADLLSQAQQELDAVRNELKEWLESLTQQALIESEQTKQLSVFETYKLVPMKMIKG